MQTVTAKAEPSRGPKTFRKRIGSTNYRVGVHFSRTSRETLDDKIIKLIRNDVENRKATGE